jgi:hypothetical protein
MNYIGCIETSLCSGSNDTCKECGYIGCNICEINNGYCDSCQTSIKISNHIGAMKDYIKYLQSILNQNRIYYYKDISFE